MIINIDDSFFVETDVRNYNLRERYIGETRQGKPREYVRTEGHFGTLEQALNRVKHIYIDRDTSTVDIDQYIDRLTELEEHYRGIT